MVTARCEKLYISYSFQKWLGEQPCKMRKPGLCKWWWSQSGSVTRNNILKPQYITFFWRNNILFDSTPCNYLLGFKNILQYIAIYCVMDLWTGSEEFCVWCETLKKVWGRGGSNFIFSKWLPVRRWYMSPTGGDDQTCLYKNITTLNIKPFWWVFFYPFTITFNRYKSQRGRNIGR